MSAPTHRKIVLFDLGDTLETGDELLPGALEMLEALSALRDSSGETPALALVSNFVEATMPAGVAAAREEYLAIVEGLGLRPYFEPVDERITISSEVGVSKPDERIFRAAVDKIAPGHSLSEVIFVTEDRGHVDAARALGMTAIHFKGPGQTRGDVDHLSELVPIVERLLRYTACAKRPTEATGRHAGVVAQSKHVDPAIASLLAKVDKGRLAETVGALAGFGTRWSYSPHIDRVAEWVHDRFVASGYPAGAATRYQSFAMPGSSPQRNVLCGPADGSTGFVLVCCHYDSVSDAPATTAPGADDDASGVAAVLEIARLLKGVHLTRGVMFAVFGGEEQGLFGSSACAEVAAAESWPIDLVVNLDMIAYTSHVGPPRIVVEYDQGNKHPGNDAAAKTFGLLMAQAAGDYTLLEVEHTDIWNSDYIPFEEKGYPCIGVYDADENPHYHKSSDTPDHIDNDRLAEVTKLVLATVLQIAR
jgi:beta-phosphoglucomutase-like phosphatase (HAD superfamily)